MMGFVTDYFDQPQYLLLLLLLPVIWALSYRSLSGLGRYRRFFALLFRSVVFSALVLALAEMQFLRQSDRMTVIYLLDQSASIPQAQREAMVEFVKNAVDAQRDDNRHDRAALIVFGREANIEVPPLEANLPIGGQLETVFDLRTDATNLAAAMKLAQATFPEDSSRRVVLVTDGNENMGDASEVAELLAADGVGLDVIPIELGNRPEVSIDRVTLPADIRRGQPFEVRAVISQVSPSPRAADKPVTGTLKLTRRSGANVETLSEQAVTLDAGKNVYSFPNTIDQPDFYEYEAVFVPAEAQDDVMVENNRATAFTQVLGQGHVLLIEDWENRGEFDLLVNRLRSQNLQVTVQPSNELFSSLAELQRYDCVVLANVPRSSGDESRVTNFSDSQIEMLVHNTQDMGCGLIMLGGPNSFGAGGWTNTELEKAMPVNFSIDNAKVVPVGALAMVMHASELAQGNYWQKKIGEEALKSLGPQDFCGVIHWEGNEQWLWAHPQGLIKVGPNKRKMLGAMSRMTPGDMPDFDPSLRMAAAAFANCTEAASKHMIVISDGDPSPSSQAVLQDFVKQKIKISTVAVGTHGPAGHTELQRIARTTQGKYYVVNNPQALPRIFQREARRVARPLVKESLVQPQVKTSHEILRGIDTPPPIRGFVLTEVKSNPLVEVSLISPDPVDEKNATILASWTYGLGRTAVLTTDAGQRWADAWTGWSGYDPLFSQLVRWAMRPTGDQGNFSVASEVADGKVRVVINALDKEDELINFLNMNASVVTPNMASQGVEIQQTAPGRYVGEFPAEQAGSYFVTILPGANHAPLRLGVNVPYSAEFRDRETNRELLKTLASRKPVGGAAGQLVEGPMELGRTDPLLKVNAFRRDLARAISSRDLWPLLLLISCCVFFGDVFVRRVQVHFEWLGPLWERVTSFIMRREPVAAPDVRMERLRERKRQVEGSLDQRRAATRFEPTPEADAAADLSALDASVTPTETKKPPASRPDMAPGQKEEDDYTTRLLKAKKQARKNDSPDP